MKKHIIFTFCTLVLMIFCSLVFVSETNIVFAGEGPRLMTRNLALMPFFIGKQPSEEYSMLDLEPEQYVMNDEVEPDADAVLTRLVQHALDKRFGNGTVDQEEVALAYADIMDQGEYLTPRDQVLALAEELGVEYVLVGNVWRYKTRTGSALASVDPSSVAFKLHLIYIPANRRIWAGVYNKTQQTLSENLFEASDFIKQRGQWVKVEDLAEIGVNDLVKRIPLL